MFQQAHFVSKQSGIFSNGHVAVQSRAKFFPTDALRYKIEQIFFNGHVAVQNRAKFFPTDALQYKTELKFF
jgi:hypothetical protein